MEKTVQRGIRGATTVDFDTKEEIKSATVELLSEIIKQNEINISDIACCIFTLTKDIKADYPAKYARLEAGFKFVPMLDYQEADIIGALEKCIRVMILVNTNKKQEEIKHIYLRGAKNLRKDLNKTKQD